MHHLHHADTLDDLRLTAKEIVLHIEKHHIVLLKGELGAGKTSLTQMICAELGVKESVTSPTYTIINEYVLPSQKKVYHFDLCRVKNANELDDIGFTEYLHSGNICLIEWPEIAQQYLNGLPLMEINIRNENDKREIELNYCTQTT